MLKKSLMTAAIFAAFATTGAAFAADAPAEEKKAEEAKGPHTLTGNFGIFSQYIFRGLTQTNRQPAAQGGFDYSHESGFYAGTWLSNISWLKENLSAATGNRGTYGGGGSVEMDVYGGYKWSLPNDFVLDLGTLYYWYPGDINTAVAPAGTPADIVDKLSGEVARAVKNEELRKRFAELAVIPGGTTPAEARKFLADEVEKWRKVIVTAGVKMES